MRKIVNTKAGRLAIAGIVAAGAVLNLLIPTGEKS